MNNQQLNDTFSELSTPLISDACLRLNLPIRFAPVGIGPLHENNHIAGRVLPARHYGSVDVFLEAMGSAQPGDVLVIDNQGRMDEGCIGDLTALEAQACGLAGIVAGNETNENVRINGAHDAPARVAVAPLSCHRQFAVSAPAWGTT